MQLPAMARLSTQVVHVVALHCLTSACACSICEMVLMPACIVYISLCANLVFTAHVSELLACLQLMARGCSCYT